MDLPQNESLKEDKEISKLVNFMEDKRSSAKTGNPVDDVEETEISSLKENKSELHGRMSFKRKVSRKKEKTMMTKMFIQKSDMRKKETREETEVKEVWLANTVEDYEEKGLLPGEMYHLSLASMTSDTQACLRSLTHAFLTKPNPAGNLKVETEDWGCFVSWSPPPPPGHSCLDGYRVEIRKAEDNSTVKPLLVKSLKRSEESVEVKVSELGRISNYTLSLFSTASRNVSFEGQENMKEKLPNLEILRESSLPVETPFTLGPLAPSNLRLESASHSSLKVKWDSAQEHEKQSYIVSTKLVSSTSESNIGFEVIKVNGDSATISKLDSGRLFLVSVAAVVNSENKCFKSKAVSIEAATRPMPPTDLKILMEDKMQTGHKIKLFWNRSASVNVTRYELTIRSEDEYHREKYIVEDVNGRKDQNEPVSFLAPITMELDIDYKINVYSLFDHRGV